jgi:hypothetical protein
MRRVAAALGLLGALLFATEAWASQDRVAVEHIDAHLDASSGGIRGVAELTFTNVTDAPLTRAYVWLYPNHFAHKPTRLDDVSFYWLYPREWNAGWMRLGQVTDAAGGAVVARVTPHARAGQGALVELTLPTPLAPGATTTLRLPYAARVPVRYGSFGCLDGECTLAGGFAPMLAQLDRAGWDLEAPPACVRHSGQLELADEADVVVGARWIAGTRVVPLAGAASTHVTLRVSHQLWRTTRVHRGVTLVYLGGLPPPPADDADKQPLSYTTEDWAKLALDAAAESLDLLAEVGVPMAEGTQLSFVEAPLRLELAQAQPGMVLVSDRMFRIFPARRFRKFHERELVRALLTEYFARRPLLPGAGARERGVDAEVSASYLLDLFTVREYKKQEFAQNVLAPVAFMPAVDALIYAPQVAFAGAYFGAIADEDAYRDDVRRFSHARPRGSVYYEKLRDLLPADAFATAMRQVVLGEARLRPAAEAAAGADLGWFFRQWGGRYPRVNYRLGDRSVAAAPGGGWQHTVRVDKLAVAGDAPPLEPVTVVAVDGDGKKHELRWDGRGVHAELGFAATSRKLRSVTLDPQSRLVESGAPGSPDDPRYDDRTPPRWKFLYNSFGLLFGSGGDLSASADFSFRRIHDNRSALRLQAYTTDTVLAGGFLGFSRRFGQRITANRPLASGSFGVGYQRLTDKLDHVPGNRVSLSASLGADDRLVLFEPMRLRGWSLGARWTMTRYDQEAYADDVNLSGAAPRGEILHTGSVAADYTLMATPLDGHTIVANAEGAVVFGDLRGSAQLLGAGGQGGLRGYGGADLLGRVRLTGHVEWRGTLTHDLNLNLGHFAWVRSVQMIGFVDAGAISGCTSYADAFASDNLYANGGLGVRIFYDNFGVQPGMTGIEVAVPFVVRPRRCLGSGPAQLPSSPPFFLYLTFVPPF